MSVIKEKQAAFNAYDDAISSGGGGYLLDKGMWRREGEEEEGR